MKLPENYENWIEFAKKCSELQEKYPGSEKIKLDIQSYDGGGMRGHRTVAEYNINAVKARAFDEVMELKEFSMDNVMHLRDVAYNHGFGTERGEFIFNLLIKLCQK